MLLNLLLRQFASSLHARALARDVPRATGAETLLTGEDRAVRVLLVGSGVTTGWGVRTHGLALVGALQQQLQTLLDDPVDVVQVSEIGAALADAPRVLGSRARERWDVIVLAFGLSDAIRQTPDREWAQALDRLLAQLDGDLPRGVLVPIAVIGVPPSPLGAAGTFGPLYRRRATRLNAITERAAGRNRRVTFIPLPQMSGSARRPEGSPEGYASWGAAVAASIAPLVAAPAAGAAPAMRDRPRGKLPEAALDPVNAAVRRSLGTIAVDLQSATDVDLVLITLLDGDRLWVASDSVEGRPYAVATSETFCAVTLQDDLVLVPDADLDPRFDALPLRVRHGLSSYGGVALRDAHGVAVGTIAVFNGRAGTGGERTALRRAGRDAERLLARLVSPFDSGTIFNQRAYPPDGVQDPDPAPLEAGAAIQEPSSAPIDDREAARRGGGPLGRRRRLRVEGRELTRTAAARSVPTGRDVRIQGPDQIRVLLVGADYAVGYGTTARTEALDGALARVLHTRTGRGVVVENRSQEGVRLEQLSASLGPAGAHAFDVVVWTPTFEEGSRTLLRSRWIAGVGLMLRKIEATSGAGVVLVGFPSLLGNQPLAVLARARAAQINRLLVFIAGRARRADLVEPPAIVLRDVQVAEGRQVYQDVAVRLLPALIRMLPDEGRTDTASPLQAAPERPEPAPSRDAELEPV